MKSIAIAGLLSLGLVACSNSSSTSASGGKTLVIESTSVTAPSQNFNPYVQSATAFSAQATGLIYEPLYIFNVMNPSQPPMPVLASGQPAWSNGGKTLTVPIRPGVKWNDGKAFTASDVAFTYNLVKKFPALYTASAPLVTSATASSPTSVTLNFASPQFANLFLIGQVYIVPQHVWGPVSNPVTYTDASPVGTGPYMLQTYSSHGFLLKENPSYWNKSSVKVANVDFPFYSSNANLVPPIASGAIDWAGSNLGPGLSNTYLGKSANNTTWLGNSPYFAANNVVTLWFNVTKPPLNDPAVRQAIGYGIDRQQLSTQGESGYEAPATSSGGLLLPIDSSYLASPVQGDLSPTGNPAKVTSILTKDGYKMVGGKWTKHGQQITFSITDPVAYTDYYTNDQLIAAQLNKLGFNVKVAGNGDPTAWQADFNNGNFDATIHWSNQGPNPFFYYENWLDSTFSAPIGKPAAGDNGRFSDPAAQAALAQFAGSDSAATQQAAITKLQTIMSAQVPMTPLLYGAAWSEISTRNFTGWPTNSNAYMTPVPNSPYLEEVVLHLKPAK
ncbi:MAG TPA: ABC transporter substrate-binding protein [Streptosporangiaceae bacterium]